MLGWTTGLKGLLGSHRLGGQQSLPAAPSALTATPSGGYARADLAWTDNSSDETGFSIERDDGGGYVEIITVGAGVTSYQGLSADTVGCSIDGVVVYAIVDV